MLKLSFISQKKKPLLKMAAFSLFLCGAGPLDMSEPNATLPNGLPVGPSTPESDSSDLPSIFSGQAATYKQEPGTATATQYGRMQIQPMNVPGPGILMTCRDTNSTIMAKNLISTKEIDTSWEVYVNPQTNQGGTLINPIRFGMTPPPKKNGQPPYANTDPNQPSDKTLSGPDGQAFKFAYNLKSMPAVYSNTVSLSGPVWCGPAVDSLETITKTIKIDLDKTTGKILNPDMVSLPDGWTLQWSSPV